ncbi:hypothetical protein A1O3_04481 [Capronia epimyces CBS 606.96]|uniref:ASST-domain-containing protein n=1 Tax=Capronia epimyces CBS 606.96 TaxID=1182542 RepID=W9YE32_9EURO|nr:uncharacterized protein A1O3_04481 [Capronia epimyces CBS 606.96]EXJ87521.1 hypothetical protein A1O3_04481 [Capronia epimyces CBS 606.96]
MLSSTIVLIIIWSCLGQVRAKKNDDLSQGNDLFSFVTRPDIRAPRFNVTKHRPKLIHPGYWFTGPYTTWDTAPERMEYQPFQVGPHIYDGDGNLVWSGAHLSKNRNAFDFRTFDANGTTFLSYILHYSPRATDEHRHGFGVFLDPSYRRQGKVAHEIGHEFNIHEFDIRDNGTKALYFTTERPEREDIYSHQKGWFAHDCINELDLTTNEANFSWCPLDHGVTLNESYHAFPDLPSLNEGAPWDFFHANSIDKFSNGDFLLSSRHTNTIYRVNRTDQSIAWRLGGKMSNFSMNFNFSSQHHATVQAENATTVTILFFDNAADDQHRQADTSTVSSVKLVVLNTETWEATAVQEWYRPHGRLSDKRGNAQMMPNGNVFIGWSDRGYMTEHTMDNQLVLEAGFLSSRFGTYRSFKANFTGIPTERPAIQPFTIRSQSDSTYTMTTTYASWNGATEVHSWRFYGSHNVSGSYQVLGQARRTGFETVFSERGAWKYVYAEAMAKNGTAIGKSAILPARFLPGSGSLVSLVEEEQEKSSLLAIIATQTSSRLRKLDKAAIAVGSVFTTLAAQVVLVLLFLVFRRSRWAGFSGWSDVREDQVQLLSKKVMND